jgi:hypothetical protein
MRNIFKILIFCFLIISCKKDLFSDDKFSLVKTSYIGTELKINGYYYQEMDGYYYVSGFFYRNGIHLYVGGRYTLTELNEFDKNIQNGHLDNKLKENKYCWGLYKIVSNEILYERYYNTDALSKQSYVMSGVILNDTTFHITKSWRSDGSEQKIRDDLYHFKKVIIKPDSVNVYL